MPKKTVPVAHKLNLVENRVQAARTRLLHEGLVRFEAKGEGKKRKANRAPNKVENL